MTGVSLSEAYELEKRGAYEAAAAAFAVHGFETLVEANFERQKSTFVGQGLLLRAVSCDARTDNDHRAKRLQSIFEHVALDLSEAVSQDVVRGLLYEWVGDSLVLVGSEDAFEWYSRAEEQFQDLDHQTQLHWGLSEAFDYHHHAYQGFVESRGVDIDHDTFLVRFLDRIDQKRAIAQRILADESGPE